MTRPDARDFQHWGMACFCFSLDLAEDLTALAVPGVPVDTIRQACRAAIMRNREEVQTRGQPVYLRALVQHAWYGPGAAEFDSYVEHAFVSPARPANSDHPLLRPLLDAARLARADRIVQGEPAGTGYAASLYSLVPADMAKTIFDAVMAVDRQIDAKSLTQWDSDLMARNAQVHSPESPLAMLISSLIRGLDRDGAERLLATLSDPARRDIQRLCKEAGHETA